VVTEGLGKVVLWSGRILGGLAPCVFVVTEGLGKVVLWSGRVLENPFKKDAWIDERGE
jgi:hypothetical protein